MGEWAVRTKEVCSAHTPSISKPLNAPEFSDLDLPVSLLTQSGLCSPVLYAPPLPASQIFFPAQNTKRDYLPSIENLEVALMMPLHARHYWRDGR